MNYKPNEQALMDYLYGELDGDEKARVEQYLISNPETRKQYEKLAGVRAMLQHVDDKEVIAPPIFVGDSPNHRKLWDIPYLRTVVSIAASLIVVLLVGRLSGVHVSMSQNEFRMSFGEMREPAINHVQPPPATLTAAEVQEMIEHSLDKNNTVLNTNWEQSQKELEASIRTSMVSSSGKMDDVIRQASTASQEQIQQYVSAMQTENMQLVKDYFKLTASEQKHYIEGLLVDFAKYLQQQQKDDLELVQLRLNNIEQNTHVFKQETEQILTSIISTVNNPQVPTQKQY